MTNLAFSLDRDVVIRAPRATVFRYFTDSARWASWWGEGSTIEGRVGGALTIVYPGGTTASGEVVAIEDGERIEFTFGYDSGQPIAAGGSRVTITLSDHADGTRVALRHDVADEAVRDMHVQGWAYQLSVFANAVANEAHAAAGERVDGWFTAWAADEDALAEALAAVATDDVAFQDGFACVSGRDNLARHILAARQHMPGMAMKREGEPRHCQGTVLAEWSAQGPDGKTMGGGTNLFEMSADGRIRRAVGFWAMG